MGKLLDNLRLQVTNLEAIEDRLVDIDEDYKSEIDSAIDELELRISEATDELEEKDKRDAEEDESENEDEQDFEEDEDPTL